MVELHRAALVPTVLDMFVRVSPGLPGEDLVHIRGLTIVLRGRVVAVVVNGDSARGRVKVVGEGHIGCLTRWPAYGEAGICAAVRPHVGALAGQDRDAGFVDAYRNVCGCCRPRGVRWIREGYGRRWWRAERDELTPLNAKVLRPVPVWLAEVARTTGVPQSEVTRTSWAL